MIASVSSDSSSLAREKGFGVAMLMTGRENEAAGVEGVAGIEDGRADDEGGGVEARVGEDWSFTGEVAATGIASAAVSAGNVSPVSIFAVSIASVASAPFDSASATTSSMVVSSSLTGPDSPMTAAWSRLIGSFASPSASPSGWSETARDTLDRFDRGALALSVLCRKETVAIPVVVQQAPTRYSAGVTFVIA